MEDVPHAVFRPMQSEPHATLQHLGNVTAADVECKPGSVRKLRSDALMTAVDHIDHLDDHGADEQCCTICFCEFSADDPRASEADAEGHGIVFQCGHGPRLHLSCLLLEAQQNRPFQCPLCRARFAFSKTCICGCQLEEIIASKPLPEYDGSGIQCDHCYRNVRRKQTVYHCPRAKIEEHPDGYDICGACATGVKLRRRARSQRTATAERNATRRRTPSMPAEVSRTSGRSSRSATASRQSLRGGANITSNFGQVIQSAMRADTQQRQRLPHIASSGNLAIRARRVGGSEL